MKNIISSITITCIVSAGVSFGLREHFNIWSTFVLAIIVQFILSYFYKSFLIFKQNNNTELTELYSVLNDIIGRSEVDVECPCGNHKESFSIIGNESNTLNCPSCNNTFNISHTLLPELVTDIESVDEVYNQLSEKRDEINKKFAKVSTI